MSALQSLPAGPTGGHRPQPQQAPTQDSGFMPMAHRRLTLLWHLQLQAAAPTTHPWILARRLKQSAVEGRKHQRRRPAHLAPCRCTASGMCSAHHWVWVRELPATFLSLCPSPPLPLPLPPSLGLSPGPFFSVSHCPIPKGSRAGAGVTQGVPRALLLPTALPPLLPMEAHRGPQEQEQQPQG